MSGYRFWTDVAIAVLLLGAPAVFIWFLTDAVRLLCGLGDDRREKDRGGTSGAESGF